MLLDFKFSNYKSFLNEADFFMTPDTRQKGLDYSIHSFKIGSTTYKGLSTSVIYGPNAAGKSNVVAAMETLKAIVMRGNIKDADEDISPNPASTKLFLIPHYNSEIAPTTFSIQFIDRNLVFDYFLSFELGKFMDTSYERKIVEESLSINGKPIFHREDTLQLDAPSKIKPYLNPAALSKFSAAKDLAESGLNDKELFLCNGFKTIFSKQLAEIITEWFADKFMVVYRCDAIKIMRKYANPKDHTVYVEKTTTDAAKAFGITSNDLGYTVDGDKVELCSFFQKEQLAIPAESFESYGTIRFINEFPLILRALLSGATLVLDEFDAAIHPMALMNIINIFHDDTLNKKHAQLIFNTHNPIFLNSSLFRRDEIKFVERSDTDNSSTLYALSDFKTADGVRKGEDYMKNYFVSRYGAIRDIDFSPIVQDVIQKETGKNG